MGRPVYPYELGDPDFAWLVSNFQENFPGYRLVDITSLPMVFIKQWEGVEVSQTSDLPESNLPKTNLPSSSHKQGSVD